jgi:hypothetical protein
MLRPMTCDEKLKVHVLYCATGVSRSKIRQILALAREMEINERVSAAQLRQRRQGVAAEVLDGGCTVYRPAVWRSRADI